MTNARVDAPGLTVGGLTFDPKHARLVKTSERVAHEIVRDIVRRNLQSGDHLPLESAMAAQYGVSRPSLREALRILEMHGMLTLKPGPGGGPVVGSVEPAHLARTLSLYFHLAASTYDDLMRTQLDLESVSALSAARHEDRVAVMAEFLEPVAAEGEAFRKASIVFHDAVYGLAGNPALALLTRAVTHTVTHDVLLRIEPVELIETIALEHTQLAQLITDGLGGQAAELMHEHFRRQHDFLRRQIPARGSDIIEWR